MTAQAPLMLSAGFLMTPAVLPAQQPSRSAPPPLPQGPGKALVESTCSKCHGLHFIVNSGGHTRAEWDELTSDDLVGNTDFARGYLGRFDPRTGAVKERASPSGLTSQPYGIATEKDIVWDSESAVTPKALVRFDPKTETFQSWAIPSGGGVVRNMMRTSNGNLAPTGSGVNRVALVEINRDSFQGEL